MRSRFRRAEIDWVTLGATLAIIVSMGLFLSAIVGGLASLSAVTKLSQERRAETFPPNGTELTLGVERAIVERKVDGIQVTLFVTNNTESRVTLLAEDLAAALSSTNLCSIRSRSETRWYFRSMPANADTHSNPPAAIRRNVLYFPADTSTRVSIILEPSIRLVSAGTNAPSSLTEEPTPMTFYVWASIPGVPGTKLKSEDVILQGSCTCDLIGFEDLLEPSPK